MNKLTVILLINLTYGISVPGGGYCASDQNMRTDSYTFDTTSSFNRTIPLSSPMTATVPFVKSQADNLYKLALCFQNLDYIIVNTHINIFISYSNAQYSSFKVNIYSTNTSNIYQIGFRYLVISSDFNKFSISYIQLAPNITTRSSCTSVSLQYFNASTLKTIIYYTGFNFAFTGIKIQVSIYIASSTSISSSICIVNTVFSLIPITINQFSVLLFRYNADDTSISVYVAQKYVLVDHSDISLPYNTINTLVGISRLMTSQTYLNFNISVSNGFINYTSKDAQDYYYSFVISAIVIQQYLHSYCPSSTRYYQPVSSTCYDVCPLGYSQTNAICLSKCGDGIVIPPEKCDNGHNMSRQGCSANCTIENDYVCDITNFTSNCSKCSSKTHADSFHQNCIYQASSPSSPSNSNNTNTLLLAILLPIFLCFIIIGLIIFCLWRRRRNAENKVVQQQQGHEAKEQKPQLQSNIPAKIDNLSLKPNETEQNQLSLQQLRLSKISDRRKNKRKKRRTYSFDDNSKIKEQTSYQKVGKIMEDDQIMMY